MNKTQNGAAGKKAGKFRLFLIKNKLPAFSPDQLVLVLMIGLAIVAICLVRFKV